MPTELLLITHCLAGIGMTPLHLLDIAMTVLCTCRLIILHSSEGQQSVATDVLVHLVIKLNPGPNGIPVIVSTRRNYDREAQPSSLSRNISNLISVRCLYALAPIAPHQHLSLCLLNARSVKNKTADFFDYICDCKADLV